MPLTQQDIQIFQHAGIPKETYNKFNQRDILVRDRQHYEVALNLAKEGIPYQLFLKEYDDIFTCEYIHNSIIYKYKTERVLQLLKSLPYAKNKKIYDECILPANSLFFYANTLEKLISYCSTKQYPELLKLIFFNLDLTFVIEKLILAFDIDYQKHQEVYHSIFNSKYKEQDDPRLAIVTALDICDTFTPAEIEKIKHTLLSPHENYQTLLTHIFADPTFCQRILDQYHYLLNLGALENLKETEKDCPEDLYLNFKQQIITNKIDEMLSLTLCAFMNNAVKKDVAIVFWTSLTCNPLNKNLDIPSHYLCPLSKQVMKDPVTLLETGHTFERQHIEKWLTNYETCPVTNQQLKSISTVQNFFAKSIIEARFQNGQIVVDTTNSKLYDCPLTLEIFKNPVLTAECGHTFEQSDLTTWLQQRQTCPLSNEPIDPKKLSPNRFAVSEIEFYRRTQIPSYSFFANQTNTTTTSHNNHNLQMQKSAF